MQNGMEYTIRTEYWLIWNAWVIFVYLKETLDSRAKNDFVRWFKFYHENACIVLFKWDSIISCGKCSCQSHVHQNLNFRIKWKSTSFRTLSHQIESNQIKFIHWEIDIKALNQKFRPADDGKRSVAFKQHLFKAKQWAAYLIRFKTLNQFK